MFVKNLMSFEILKHQYHCHIKCSNPKTCIQSTRFHKIIDLSSSKITLTYYYKSLLKKDFLI